MRFDNEENRIELQEMLHDECRHLERKIEELQDRLYELNRRKQTNEYLETLLREYENLMDRAEITQVFENGSRPIINNI